MEKTLSFHSPLSSLISFNQYTKRIDVSVIFHPVPCLINYYFHHLFSFFSYSETERQREKERLAAIAIQTNWRMLKVKWNFKKKVRACVLISRVFRGHIARLRVDSNK